MSWRRTDDAPGGGKRKKMTERYDRKILLFKNGELLTLDEIVTKTKFSKSYIYELMDQNRFPRSIKFSVQTVRWISDDVNKWFENFVNDAGVREKRKSV